ncbi:MAG: hypothetical protein H5T50_02530 [Nitrososphaeria archaeon]|nr:hypothetical protein [Nitrososphaeria archaeon]
MTSKMSELFAIFEEHDRNWSWFKEHYDELVEKFDGEFVAVCEQKVIDHDREINVLMKRVREKYPKKHVLVEFVSREKIALIL